MHVHVLNRRARAVAAVVAALLVIAALVPPPSAEASHFRATQVNWHTTTGNEVEFHLTGSFRCTFYFASPCSASPGDTFGEYSIDFGDGDFAGVVWTVVSSDAANDVVNAEAHLTHDYFFAGTYTATVGGCCRLGSSNGHQNNPSGDLVLTTTVRVGTAATANPVSQVSPIVDCPSGPCSFQVPAIDPDGRTLSYRLAAAGDPEVDLTLFSQPTGAAIDATTGLYTWDATGITPPPGEDWFYSTIVIVESRDAGGTLITRTPVDFFIRIGDTTNSAPFFEAPTPADGTVIPATVGTPVTFDTQASDPDVGDTVTLGHIGPAGVSYVKTAGNPATGAFSWTPSVPGTYLVTLTAADQLGRQAVQRTVTIDVTAGSNTAPVADAGGPYTGDEGSPIGLDGSGSSDVDGDTLTYLWSVSPVTADAGASCSFDDDTAVMPALTCDDDGTFEVTVTVDDGTTQDSDTATVTVDNVAPDVTITAPAAGSWHAASSPVMVSADATDPGTNDTHTCEVDFGDGSAAVAGTFAAGTCTASYAYPSAGLYTITVYVTDDDGGVGTDTVDILVFAPGTITGGGWLYDGDGARLHTGFVAGYRDDGGLIGQLQLSWTADGVRHRFHAETVDSVLMTDDAGTWTGTGRYDGVSGYSYEVTATDNGKPGKGKRSSSTPDHFAVTITAPDGTTIVYTVDAPLTRGNYVRHH